MSVTSPGRVADGGVPSSRQLNAIVVVADARQRTDLAVARAAMIAHAAPGARVSVVPRAGLRGADVVRLCAEADLLVFGDRLQTVSGALFGGLSVMRALRELRKPVLIVKRRPLAPYQAVLVGAELEPSSGRLVSGAAMLAPRATVDVVHVQACAYEGKLRYAGVPDAFIETYRHGEIMHALHRMSRTLTASGAPDRIRARVVHGDAVRGIVERAHALGADLIVTGRRRRTPLDRVFGRSVSAGVVAASDADVVIFPDA